MTKITNPAIQKPADTDEIYYSNYFSFQGSSKKDTVLFAIDNNRWKRKGKFGADRFLAMHTGGHWIKLIGKGDYENTGHSLQTIPSDSNFVFKGTPDSGLEITSSRNDLKLTIAPLKQQTRSADGYARFNMASAKATLTWKSRKIEGAVIQEYLRAPNFSKRFKQFLRLGGGSFTGLYLNVAGKGSLYIHQNAKDDGGFSFISKRENAFSTFPFKKSWSHFKFQITHTHKHLFYSFPLKMKVVLSKSNPATVLKVHTVNLKTFNNYFFFGFAMGVVKGTLRVGAEKYPVFGFSELIAT